MIERFRHWLIEYRHMTYHTDMRAVPDRPGYFYCPDCPKVP